MNPPPALVQQLLTTGSASTAHVALTDRGYTISFSRLETIRSVLIAQGIAKRISPADVPNRGGLIADPATDAGRGSHRLLMAQIAADQACHAQMAAWEARHGVAA